MNLEEAIRLAIKAYYTGELPERFMEQFPDMKYTPEYFAKLEADIEAKMKGDAGERLDEEDMSDVD